MSETLLFSRDGVLVLIPLYNHGATVRRVAQGVLALGLPLVVVDDGSSDGGADALTGLDLTLLRHKENRGKGAAILTGLAHAAAQGMSHLLTIDADGQHDPADIEALLAVQVQDPGSIVVGKRDFTAAAVPGGSRFGRQFSNFWLQLQTGIRLGDVQSGFRCYPVAVLERLKLRQSRYAFEVEVLVKAAWGGVALRDAPISVYYPPGDERISHFDLWRDNLRLTLLNSHLTLRSLLPWPHRPLFKAEAEQPGVSILRPLRSLRLLLAEHSTPLQLALAAALGVLLGALPLIACHTIAILAACSFLRLNRVAAVAASQLCMPPIVPALCIEVGYFLRHGEFLTEISLRTLGYQFLERLWEYLLGSLLLAPLLALVVGGLVFLLAGALRRTAEESLG
ncbi:DUF2062 domain-containing protein [Geothermobacter hydrogeniphilus]|uniref:DUF2062 domain-containing protein n=1 Tax=Geothermobacter hydrogeniphilus TaxID=1969733 RepID=A0A2K2HBE5_9BACT|nr:glycosyltransferase family 2 protein [Geothermobacter hydrogeniphilus]PNU20632.1 DUF2062 domain-containing protein [Geothermobacter hydrogeniphilus]